MTNLNVQPTITIRTTLTLTGRDNSGRQGPKTVEGYDPEDWRDVHAWATDTLSDNGCVRHNHHNEFITEEPRIVSYARGEEETKSATLSGFTLEQLQAIVRHFE